MAKSENAAKQAYDYLMSQGLSSGAALGVVANLVAESGLSVSAVGDSGAAHGIAQWHPDRYAAMQQWVMAHGLNPNTLEGQLAYVVQEAKTGVGGNVWPQLLQTKDPLTATELFMRGYERPADQSASAAKARLAKGYTALSKGLGVAPDIPFGNGTGAALDTAVGGVVDATKGVGDVVSWISDAHNLLRVVEVVGGGVLIVVGLAVIARPQISSAVSLASKVLPA